MKIERYLGVFTLLGFVASGAVACGSADAVDALGEEAAELRKRQVCAGPQDRACPADQFCNGKKIGRCPGPRENGFCAPRPEICTREFNPVCGCDGVTYPNACTAAASGVAVESLGACEPDGEFCGGIAGIPCDEGEICIDDPSDECDPEMGGADCGGVCVADPCAGVRCPGGTQCVAEDGIASCEPIENPCAVVLCAEGTQCVVVDGRAECVAVERCGEVVCAPGLTCCNPLRSICTRPGEVCIF